MRNTERGVSTGGWVVGSLIHTVECAVDEGHVEPEELHNRFAHEQREGTDESLGHDVLPPGRSVRRDNTTE